MRNKIEYMLLGILKITLAVILTAVFVVMWIPAMVVMSIYALGKNDIRIFDWSFWGVYEEFLEWIFYIGEE